MQNLKEELAKARELVRMLEEKQKQSKVELGNLQPGETFMIGEHEFIVLEQCGNLNDMSNETQGITKVISKNFMAEDVKFGDSKDYKTSNLRKVIEKDIQPIIEAEVGADNMVRKVVDLTSVDMQNEYGTCECAVRPLTFDEARKYNDLIVNEDLDDWWWTCTPWSTEKRGYKYSITVVSPRGSVGSNIYVNDFGVRPFCILKSNIFVSKGV